MRGVTLSPALATWHLWGPHRAPPSGARGRRPAAATFELQRVVAPYSERPPAANTSAAGDGNFAEAVRASVEVHAGRRVVLATYYNLGMLDWAEIFWGWLVVSGYRHLLLLDLDGLTCDASRALLSAHGPPLSRLNLACARAVDMALGKLRDAGTVVGLSVSHPQAGGQQPRAISAALTPP